MVKIGKEYLPISCCLDSHRRDHTSCTDCAQDGEDLPSAIRRCLVNAPASGTTGVESRHLRRDATFIQINQAFRRGGADCFDELRTPLSVRFGVALLGVE